MSKDDVGVGVGVGLGAGEGDGLGVGTGDGAGVGVGAGTGAGVLEIGGPPPPPPHPASKATAAHMPPIAAVRRADREAASIERLAPRVEWVDRKPDITGLPFKKPPNVPLVAGY